MDFLCRRAMRGGARCGAEPARREEYPDTEVVVIGNGPAGLAVSAFLSGIHPYYDSLRGHPDDDVHRRLTRLEHASLIDQDLAWYEQKVIEQADRAMGYLYDTLARPSIDAGLHRPSCLRWAADPARAVPHVVLGATAPGGSWTTHDPEMVAVSVGGLLDLPGFPMAAWMQDMKSARERQPASVVAAYMRDYPRRVGISARVRSGTTVTRLEKTPAGLWRVSGVQASGRPFSLVARRVVLATGLMEQRMLEVEGESGNARVVYTMQQLKEAAGEGEITDPTAPSSSAAAAASAALPPVIVVGDGVSAADAVLFCMERGMRVVHVMRKNEHELRRSAGRLRSRFSATLYPEYYNVFELMQGRQKHPLYERRVAARVERIEGATAYLRTRAGVKEEPFSLLAACIGQRSTFEGVLPGGAGAGGDQALPSSFGRDYRSEDDPSLFCVGSAVGDHYVRFLVGGCMHVAQQIVAEHEGGRNLVVDDPLLDTVVGEDTVIPPPADAFLDGDDGLLEISC